MTALPGLEPATDALPEGRYRASVDAVRGAFATSEYRNVLLDEWVAATEMLRSVVPVCAAWLGGSFFTGKPDPSDIDSIYFVDEQHLQGLSEDQMNVLNAFANAGVVEQFTGLRVDSYVVAWSANATPRRDEPRHRQYYEQRGYWDDLWSKKRTGPQGSAPLRLDSHPRRGYVEVILDGYDENGPFYSG